MARQSSLFNQELAQLQTITYRTKVEAIRTKRSTRLKLSAKILAEVMEALLSGDPALIAKNGIGSEQCLKLAARLSNAGAALQRRGR